MILMNLQQVGSSPALSRSGSTSSLASSLSCAPVQEVADADVDAVADFVVADADSATIIVIITTIIMAGANPHHQLPTVAGPGDQGDQEVDVGEGHHHLHDPSPSSYHHHHHHRDHHDDHPGWSGAGAGEAVDCECGACPRDKEVA